MNRTLNLVLAGFMGTGKSTVGPLVARRLQRAFIDTDEVIERAAGMTVREIFAASGEPAFRELEHRAIAEAASMSGVVISIGGGALGNPENRCILEESGVLVLLTCRVDTLIGRLEESARRGERPMLGENLAQSIESLLAARDHVYATVALQVDTTYLTPDDVADRLLAIYRQAAAEEVPA